MRDVRGFLASKLKNRGLSMKEASQAIGRNHAYLQQFIERGTPQRLPEHARDVLAGLLGVSSDDLRDAPRISGGAKPAAKMVSADRLPVLGMAECGPDGWSLWNGDVIDTLPRPSGLAGAPSSYAVYVVGTSMEPRYRPGEVVYVHPGRPVAINDYVLVQKKPAAPGEAPQAVIKLLLRRSPMKLTLAQHNPAQSFEIKTADIVSIHKVVGSGEA